MKDEKILCIGDVGNKFYFALEQHDINRLIDLPTGCEVEVNLGKKIDLIGGNSLILSSDLIISVVLLNDKFVED